MKIVIIDGQGGKIGSMLVKKIKELWPAQEIYAIGTNSIATATMLKSGAEFGATGENPVVRNTMDADIIIGPIGIIVADAILGEVTHKMAAAVGSSFAQKILIPIKNCHVSIAGTHEQPLANYIEDAIEILKTMMK